MMQAWRANIQRWSRSKRHLQRTAFGIVATGFLGALLIIALTPEPPRFSADVVEQRQRQEWQRLMQTEKPEPHALVQWLAQTISQVHHLSKVLEIKTTTWGDFEKDGKLAGFEVQPLILKHTQDPAIQQLWKDFIRVALSGDTVTARQLAQQAAQDPPPLTANFIQALQIRETVPSSALGALMREAHYFPEASSVREYAFSLAVLTENTAVLRQIADQPDWWAAMPAGMRQHAATQLGEFWLQWNALLEYRSLLDAPWGTLVVALLAAAIWYIILVLHGVHGNWRWAAPLLPLTAGILSVWPVFAIDSWQEVALGMKEDSPFPHDLWYQVGGVAMREELSKLFLAALFMPWLLLKRPPGGALMVGAFVGLGFALEENINYYLEYDSGVPLTRFITANFMHAALTGISTHALYHLLRTRLGSADRFLATFFTLVLAHGCYNYAYSIKGIEGTSLFSMIILALTAWHFLDLVGQECVTKTRQILTPAAVFLIGTALLMAATFLSLALRTPDRQLLTAAAASCVSILPVAFIYWRRMGI